MENNNEPEYVAKKSAWKAVTLFRILFAWLIIPLIIMIVQIVQLKFQKIEFYDTYIVQRSGVIARNERKSAFIGIISVSIQQTVAGRLFNYGNITVDTVGKWDIDTRGISEPERLKKYLNTRMVNPNNFRNTTMFVA